MITIIVDNYKEQRLTYTMPDTATIKMVSENVFNVNEELIRIGLCIDVTCTADIKLKAEK